MQSLKLYCNTCTRPILYSARYCCNPKKYVCLTCSSNRCTLCSRMRNNILEIDPIAHNSPVFSTKIQKRSRCCNCKQEQVVGKNEFFYEEKCKMYYCHACTIVFYSKYCTMINRLQQQFGTKPEIQVELRCGCEIQTKKIVDFVQRYCYHCSVQIDGAFVILKNQARIMRRCIDYIKSSAQMLKYNRAQQQKAKEEWAQIKMLLISCQNCKDVLDGDRAEIGEKIGEIYLCRRCLRLSKQYEQLYDKKSEGINDKNQKEQPKPLRRQQPIDKPAKIQGNNQRKTRLQCEICHVGIIRLIENQSICLPCFDLIDSGNNLQILDEHSQKSKIKPVNDRQIAKDRQEIVEKSVSNKSMLKQKPEQGRQKPSLIKNNGNKPKQSKVPDNKNPLQSKTQVKLDQSLLKNMRQAQVEEVEIQRQPPIPIPKEQSNSKIHPQFYPPPTITLSIRLPLSDTLSCSECSYQIPSINSFKVFRRDHNLQSTSRIAQTEEEMSKYQKENMIKIFCKGCYMRMKQRLKQAEKRKELLKSQGGGRYGYSVSKRDPKKETTVLNTAEKLKKNEDYGGEIFPKRFTDLKVSGIESPLKKVSGASKQIKSPSYQCKLCMKKKRFQEMNNALNTCKECQINKRMTGSFRDKVPEQVEISVFCKVCQKMVKYYDMNKVKGYCKDCQIKIIQADTKHKRDDFKKVKCLKCIKTFTTTEKETVSVKYCSECMTRAFLRN